MSLSNPTEADRSVLLDAFKKQMREELRTQLVREMDALLLTQRAQMMEKVEEAATKACEELTVRVANSFDYMRGEMVMQLFIQRFKDQPVVSLGKFSAVRELK